jgi:hypothetical protein
MIYLSCDVWRRLPDGTLARYRCFRLLPSGGYCVQSRDIYDPQSPSRLDLQHDQQFFELLTEEAPELRGGVFPNLEDAIFAHDSEFGEIEE